MLRIILTIVYCLKNWWIMVKIDDYSSCNIFMQLTLPCFILSLGKGYDIITMINMKHSITVNFLCDSKSLP